ncbi:DUF2971 domain-containing protein [Sulfurimonas sp. HSL1-2]|uniref:DUF2971 domain-containing protein n=1 Tax=Thiomicrolovo zhangzhouensis TaxID=3131933 RepID=UPI0031F994F3
MSTKLYKYRSFNDQFLNNIIINSSLYYSPIKYFNDPFDCRLSFREKYSNKERKLWLIKASLRNPQFGKQDIKEMMAFYTNEKLIKMIKKSNNELIDNIGVLSLSATHDNILMWSHYSNSHNGLVFEFEPLNYDGYDCLYHPIKVDYDEKYELLSYLESDDGSELVKLMLTKHIDWKYENEYRCIDIGFQGEKKFHKDELKSIFFGLDTTTKQIEEFKKLCLDNGFTHLNFKKAKKINGKFELAFDDI